MALAEALRQAAAQQAHAEFGPQIRGVRTQTQGQIASLRSITPALQDSLQLAEHQIRGAGLAPSDLAMAEKAFANQTADAGASQALNESQVHQIAHAEIRNLLASQGQAQRSALTTLLHEAAQNQLKAHERQASNAEKFKLDILKEEALKQLGLKGGLTGAQQRSQDQSQHTAAHYAQEYVHAARNGVWSEVKNPKTGLKEHIQTIPAGPHTWSNEIWQHLVDQVKATSGVKSLTDAEHAVAAVRQHFQPPPSDVLHSLGTLGNVAVRALAPPALQGIPQFAGALTGHP